MPASLRAALAATAVVVGVGGVVVGGGTAWAGQPDHDGKITICHVTNGANPWVKITVDDSAVLSAHVNDSADGRTDIIPSFSYTDHGQQLTFPGKGDQSILAQGCSISSPATTTPATTAPTPPPTTVLEESFPEEPETTVPEQPPTTVPEQPTTTVPEESFPEEPETTVPEQPETTVPEQPETTVPEQPEVTVPEVTVPEVTIPEQPETAVPTPTPEVAEPADVPTVAAAPDQAQPTGRLPETGAATGGLVVAGLGALVAGFGLVQLTARRRAEVTEPRG